MLVWDDEVEVAPDEQIQMPSPTAPLSASLQFSIRSVPLPRRHRSQSAAGDFPPPMRRTSTEAPRPVPFSAKFQRVHPGTTGVTVLEHLERLDAVEASLKRLGPDSDDVIEEEEGEEVDVGESSKPRRKPSATAAEHVASSPAGSSLFSPQSPPQHPETLTPVPEVDSSAVSIHDEEEDDDDDDELNEQDLAAMSKSTSHVEGSLRRPAHGRWATTTSELQSGLGSRIGVDTTPHAGWDWIQSSTEEAPKRVMIVEVCAMPHFLNCP